MKKKEKMTNECIDVGTCECGNQTDELTQLQINTSDPDPTDQETDAFFAQLQAAWDEHSRRIDEFVARNGEYLDQYNRQIVQAIQRRHRARRIKTAALLLSVPVAMFFIYAYCYPFLRTFYCLILATVATYSFFGRERKSSPHSQFSVLSLSLISVCRSRVVGCVSLALIATIVCFHAADGNNITSLSRDARTALWADIGNVLNNTPSMS